MSRNRRRAFTLIEVLVATALTLMIMAATVTLFGSVTEGIAGSRAIIETMDRLRATQERLALDLRGVTAQMTPPLRPEWGLGYFEYVDGTTPTASTFVDSAQATPPQDTTIADNNDVLMFTTHSSGEPFLGLYNGSAIQSRVAEVAWFVRGTTLYRRVLLVVPQIINDSNWTSVHQSRPFYAQNDISVRQIGGSQDIDDWPSGTIQADPRLVPNTLGDLTKRENRYGHQPRNAADSTSGMYGFPHSIANWGELKLPLLQECSSSNWPFPLIPTGAPYSTQVTLQPTGVTLPAVTSGSIDLWTAPYTNTGGAARWTSVDQSTGCLNGYIGTRIGEDVIMTNVIGFDVKAWDPEAPVYSGTGGTVLVPGDPNYPGSTVVGYGAYVDLGYSTTITSHFSGTGDAKSQVSYTYDTGSTHYEADGIDQDGANGADQGTNGLDDDNAKGIDDAGEMEAPPPYAHPLKGIQIKIRVFEPDSRQIREVTVVQDFLPE